MLEDVTVVLTADRRAAAHQVHAARHGVKRLPIEVGVDAKGRRHTDARHFDSIFAWLLERGEIGDVQHFVGVVVPHRAGQLVDEDRGAVADANDGESIPRCGDRRAFGGVGQVTDRVESDRPGAVAGPLRRRLGLGWRCKNRCNHKPTDCRGAKRYTQSWKARFHAVILAERQSSLPPISAGVVEPISRDRRTSRRLRQAVARRRPGRLPARPRRASPPDRG